MRTNDSADVAAPEVTLRIPGTWSRPEEFYEGLPRGCRCTENGLVLADGTEFELNVLPADEQFPEIFAGSCPKLPTESERERIENFKVNICLTSGLLLKVVRCNELRLPFAWGDSVEGVEIAAFVA